MRVGGALADSETGVEKEDALVGPAGEAAVTGVPPACHITAQLLVHVHQGGGRRHTLLHGEAEAVGLALAMVRVLTCAKAHSPSDRYLVTSVFDPDWIRIQWGPWIRIRNPNPDLDPRAQKWPTKVENS